MQKTVDCSVIIPVYNSGTKIQSILNCFSNLLGFDIEIIVIDDGSTDGCGRLCDEYAIKDKRVRVFHKENGGVSSARNLGLKKVQGKYVYFADSDDLVNAVVLMNMIALAESSHADIVFANYETEDISSGVKTVYNCKIPTGDGVLDKNYIERILLYRFYSGDNVGLSMICNKLYSAKLIKDAGIAFDEKRAHGEDWAFNIKILQYAEQVAVLNETVYTYRLDGSQNYNKYRKNLGYALSNGYETICNLNAKYKFVDDNSREANSVAINFLGQIAQYLKMDNVPRCEKKRFIKTVAVKNALKKIINIKNNELGLYDISRRTKLAARLMSLGSIKISMVIYR